MEDDHQKQMLREIFINIHENKIDEVIKKVKEDQYHLTSDEQFESMIDVLTHAESNSLYPNFGNIDDDEEKEEGAIGYVKKVTDMDIQQLLEVFPDICLDYLDNFCKKYNNFNLETALEDLTKVNYDKIKKDYLDVWDHLKEMLPNADPIYLKNEARVLVDRPTLELNEFIQKLIETNDYPTMQEYLKKKKDEKNIMKYTNYFNVDLFLEEIPNAIEYFNDTERKPVLEDENITENDVAYALNFFYNKFPCLRIRIINRIFNSCNNDLIKINRKLKQQPKAFKTPREPVFCEFECQHFPLLKELAFIQNEQLIKFTVKTKNEEYNRALKAAEALGLLQTCKCCFDERLLPEECYFCNEGCIFCKECVKLGAEVRIGNGELNFPCLDECGSEFSYFTLQMVLDKKVFYRLFQRKQIFEIRQANIDGLETCPFCDFSMVPIDSDKIFKCVNEDCMKESCRLCRHESHIPLRCNEIEYDEDVKMRTYIENKMSEALLRECKKCSRKFYKESGCNKMTCICGTTMCYICGASNVNYNHFGNTGCTLYTNDLKQFHFKRVLNAANVAKAELGINQDASKLKFDPVQNFQ